MDIPPKEIFTTINDATTAALRKAFGPPDRCEDSRLMAKVAVAAMQMSLFYFSQTGAPKEVVRDFFEKLIGDGPDGGEPAVKQQGSHLILAGQSPSMLKKMMGG